MAVGTPALNRMGVSEGGLGRQLILSYHRRNVGGRCRYSCLTLSQGRRYCILGTVVDFINELDRRDGDLRDKRACTIMFLFYIRAGLYRGSFRH